MVETPNPNGDIESFTASQAPRAEIEPRITPLEDLKIGLFNQGIKVSRNARTAIEGGIHSKPLSTGDYASTSGIALYLGHDIYVNAPIIDYKPNFVTDQTPFSLKHDGENFSVTGGLGDVKAEYIPVPDYWDKTNEKGIPIRSLVVTHIDRARISPIEGCAIACQFCNIPYELRGRYKQQIIGDMVDAVRVAIEDPVLPAKHLLISGGTPKEEDFSYINQVYEQMAGSFPGLAVDVMMAPVAGLLDPETLKRDGVHGLAINLELFNPEIAKRKARGKFDIGRENYLRFIEDAVGVFGLGKIRSLLIVGIEPLEDTLKGVRALAERGCDPVLSPLVPDPATPLKDEKPPSVELQREAYLRAREIVDKYNGVVLGPRCIPDQHNTLAFPYKSGGSFYRHIYKPS